MGLWRCRHPQRHPDAEVSTGAASVHFAVTVAESTRARSALARAILIRSALRLAVLVLGVATLVWLAVTVALRPLERLGDAIAERSPDDLRPVTADTPEEVEPLVQAINLFMVRLKTALDALRNFTGNASHQLRTPLAVVRTQLALMDRSADPDEAAMARDSARAALERAERVLSHLLVLARVDASAGAAVLGPVDMVAIAKEVTSDLVPAALQQTSTSGSRGRRRPRSPPTRSFWPNCSATSSRTPSAMPGGGHRDRPRGRARRPARAGGRG